MIDKRIALRAAGIVLAALIVVFLAICLAISVYHGGTRRSGSVWEMYGDRNFPNPTNMHERVSLQPRQYESLNEQSPGKDNDHGGDD